MVARDGPHLYRVRPGPADVPGALSLRCHVDYTTSRESLSANQRPEGRWWTETHTDRYIHIPVYLSVPLSQSGYVCQHTPVIALPGPSAIKGAAAMPMDGLRLPEFWTIWTYACVKRRE